MRQSKTLIFFIEIMIKKKCIILLILLSGVYAKAFCQVSASNTDKNEYIKVITQRSAKIVDLLNISDSLKYKRVLNIVAEQYRSLNDIDNTRAAQGKQIKEQAGEDKAIAAAKIAGLDSISSRQIKAQHQAYLLKLSKELNADEVEKVKDGMTYRIYPITYTAYLDELPNLTAPQKEKIKGWLLEARELAMDAGSSEKKHAWFGKYKGRINNYLSAQGYDMKKEGEEWQKRIKEKAASANKQ